MRDSHATPGPGRHASDQGRIQAGSHFLQGNVACAEGAIAAGCRFFAGYPITPATEIAERLAQRLPEVGGVCIQMEDEIASMGAVIGASWTGAKAMTATSGPGFSLMQENIGYAVGTETPCVIVDVQRGGPTTGIPAVSFQGDVIQARRGSHGEYEMIAFAPSSPQEMFDLTIRAFNVSELLRSPVILLADAFVGHMRESVSVPLEISLADRTTWPEGADPQEVRGFLDENVAPFPTFGRGLKSHVTGSCHDERGHRNVVDAEALDKFVRRLSAKIRNRRDDLVLTSSDGLDGAETALLGYGSTARAAQAAAILARSEGLMVGSFKLTTIWPFPDREVEELAGRVRRIVVLENNLGQVVHYVAAAAKGKADVEFMPPATLGTLHHPGHVVAMLTGRRPGE